MRENLVGFHFSFLFCFIGRVSLQRPNLTKQFIPVKKKSNPGQSKFEDKGLESCRVLFVTWHLLYLLSVSWAPYSTIACQPDFPRGVLPTARVIHPWPPLNVLSRLSLYTLSTLSTPRVKEIQFSDYVPANLNQAFIVDVYGAGYFGHFSEGIGWGPIKIFISLGRLINLVSRL